MTFSLALWFVGCVGRGICERGEDDFLSGYDLFADQKVCKGSFFFFFNIIIIVNNSREWSRKYSPQRKGIEGKVVCPFCGTGLRNDPRDSL